VFIIIIIIILLLLFVYCLLINYFLLPYIMVNEEYCKILMIRISRITMQIH